MEFLVKLDQRRRLIATIRAPRSTDRQHYHAAAKSRIRIGHQCPVEIGSAEVKRLAGIPDAGET